MYVGGEPRDGANMSPQDSVVLASRPNWRAPASTQIKRRARLQRGALLFYLIGGICYIGEPLLLSLKHVNTMCACRHEHALHWKKCMCHTHTCTNLFFQPPQSCIAHAVSRCLEIPCSVMTSSRLQYNTGSVLSKLSRMPIWQHWKWLNLCVGI